MTFRIFTNDRQTVRGKPMYSALCDIAASSPEAALKKANKRWPQFGESGGLAPIAAIHWPESAQSQDEKAWLAVHVGGGTPVPR
jgi:hypothetical protein